MAGEPVEADYGLDAPGVVVGNAVAGAAALAGAGIGWAALRRRHRVPAVVVGGWLAVWGLVAVAQAGLMVRSSRAGKLIERDRLLDELPWRGDEWVLDVDCGRGLLPIGAAKRLTIGQAVGLDLWRKQDQAGNDPAATLANAQAEGVAERVELRDGDARQLPFDDQTFDVVVSSMALHNIAGAGGGPRRSARSCACSSRAAGSPSSTFATPDSTRRCWQRPGSAMCTARSAALACIHRYVW
jgi:arsenite methyltransferase